MICSSRDTDGWLRLRPAQSADLDDCVRIRPRTIKAYRAELRLSYEAGEPSTLRAILEHILTTDPDRFWVAERIDSRSRRIVGFGAATLRSDRWFLGALYIDVGYQYRGIGRRILEAILPSDAGTKPGALATSTDSLQPTSNALYIKYGMIPRLPIFRLTGDLTAVGLGSLPVTATDMAAQGSSVWQSEQALIATLDRSILGYPHPIDHDFVRGTGAHGWLFWDHRGRFAAYGYLSEDGTVGPVGAVTPSRLLPVLATLGQRSRSIGRHTLWMAGTAGSTLPALLRAGFRIDGYPALVCSSSRHADFGRYVPRSLTVL